MVKNNAFFNTLEWELDECIDIFIGIVELYNTDNLYKLYLAQVPIMALGNEFITFDEYKNKNSIKVIKKTKEQVLEESLDILKCLKGGE